VLYLQNCAKRRKTASPAQIFLGRRVRTPLHPVAAQNQVTWKRHFQDRVREQERMKRYYDRTASQPARGFKTKTPVLVHNVRGKALTAVVISQTGPQTYIVEFPNGARSVCNRNFLTPLPRSTHASTKTRPTIEEYLPAIPTPWTSVASPPARVVGVPVTRSVVAARPAAASAAVQWIPRQNPMSPPRPSTVTTRSGRAVVPTLRGLNA
jgi:hypothetical protein